VNACGDINKRGSARVSSLNPLPPHPTLPIISPQQTNSSFLSPTSNMTDQSGPSHFQEIFEAAFRDFEKQTGKTLANHPLAEKLQNCDSVESVTAVLREQTETFSEIRGKDKVLKPLKNVLSVLNRLFSASDPGLVRP
jgi:hypothetical protein